jgi:guanylate kinase
MTQGKVIIFSAPSGSGKTTVVRHLLSEFDELAFSVSATTRKKRKGELDGKDYYFFSEEDFQKKLVRNEFLEHEEVYKGLHYGTLNAEIVRIWKEGKTVLFDVDVVGGVNIKKHFGQHALAVFLRPPSLEVLMERLVKRKTEVEHQLKERVEKAKHEMQFEKQFDILLVNDVLEHTFAEAESLVKYFLKLQL